MEPAFDPQRFEALVLYIANKTADDPKFGRTKLAKVLFYSDFNAYRDEGASLTGATYIRLPRGPFPKQLEAVEERLHINGIVRLAYDVPDYEEKKIVPLEPLPDLAGLFVAWQLVLVDLWIKDISAATARRISHLSHDHPGWILARENGSTIPYESAYAPNQMPPEEAVELGRRLAREHQWA
jgi:hypothetical protein